jgi:hypothetical protein
MMFAKLVYRCAIATAASGSSLLFFSIPVLPSLLLSTCHLFSVRLSSQWLVLSVRLSSQWLVRSLKAVDVSIGIQIVPNDAVMGTRPSQDDIPPGCLQVPKLHGLTLSQLNPRPTLADC